MIVPKLGRLLLAQWLYNATGDADEALKVALFKNDFTPDVDSVFASFTPSAFTGAFAADTSRDRFTGAALSGDFAVSRLRSSGDNDFFRWEVTGAPETIYGWYAYDVASESVIGAERFAAPIVGVIGTVVTLFLDYDLGKFIAD